MTRHLLRDDDLSPAEQDVDNTLASPSAAHLLGTDDLGRDVFSRMVHGGAATLYASGLAVGIALLLGPKKTALLMTGQNGQARTSLVGCYYFYQQ